MRTRHCRLCVYDESGAVLIYQNTPTVADGMPGSIMLRACDDRFPSKTVRSTVNLKEVIEFSAVVCVCLSSRNRRGYQGGNPNGTCHSRNVRSGQSRERPGCYYAMFPLKDLAGAQSSQLNRVLINFRTAYQNVNKPPFSSTVTCGRFLCSCVGKSASPPRCVEN